MSGVLFFMNDSAPLMSADRDQALYLLNPWLVRGILPEESENWTSSSALTREMVYSCIRHRGSLDAWIDHLSNQPPSDRVRPLLWIGLCQILLLDGIADHAAVHETLEAGKRSGIPQGQIGFANALFRRTLRESEALIDWLDKQSLDKRYSHPMPLIQRWQKTFGKEETLRICAWNQQRSHTFARMTKIGKKIEVQNGLGEAFTVPEGFPDFVQLPRGCSPTSLPGFDQGAWYIQDPSTSLAPALLAVQPGERVLDACAAPGGKTALLAEALGDQTNQLLACDPNPKRLQRLKENMLRLRHSQVRIRQAEPADLATSHAEQFDAVLLDVPCSNTGVYQRRPDAKWSFRKKMLIGLVQLQYSLMSDAAKLVKTGGRIAYSTCSIEAEETTLQMERWLGQNPDWSLVESTLLLPGQRNCDGAFAALLQKNV
jgi:16S rRNA (cytosine967-C5)-methyltransferase